jgi:hypothetical protein
VLHCSLLVFVARCTRGTMFLVPRTKVVGTVAGLLGLDRRDVLTLVGWGFLLAFWCNRRLGVSDVEYLLRVGRGGRWLRTSGTQCQCGIACRSALPTSLAELRFLSFPFCLLSIIRISYYSYTLQSVVLTHVRRHMVPPVHDVLHQRGRVRRAVVYAQGDQAGDGGDAAVLEGACRFFFVFVV